MTTRQQEPRNIPDLPVLLVTGVSPCAESRPCTPAPSRPGLPATITQPPSRTPGTQTAGPPAAGASPTPSGHWVAGCHGAQGVHGARGPASVPTQPAPGPAWPPPAHVASAVGTCLPWPGAGAAGEAGERRLCTDPSDHRKESRSCPAPPIQGSPAAPRLLATSSSGPGPAPHPVLARVSLCSVSRPCSLSPISALRRAPGFPGVGGRQEGPGPGLALKVGGQVQLLPSSLGDLRG